jgi:hypothetical protein
LFKILKETPCLSVFLSVYLSLCPFLKQVKLHKLTSKELVQSFQKKFYFLKHFNII